MVLLISGGTSSRGYSARTDATLTLARAIKRSGAPLLTVTQQFWLTALIVATARVAARKRMARRGNRMACREKPLAILSLILRPFSSERKEMDYEAFDSHGEMEHTPELDAFIEAQMQRGVVPKGLYYFPTLDIEIEFDSSIRDHMGIAGRAE